MANFTLEKFDCEGEATLVAVRWERWKRSLYIYFEAANVTTPSQKKANLLHWGGEKLQEIFFNIPDTNEIEPDVFEIAIKKLDEYFAPKQSRRFERYVFRGIRQEENEKIEKFIERLRQQAAKCQFVDLEDQLLDQVTEKCSSYELRRKILKTGDKMTLEEVIADANALEVTSRQSEESSQKPKNNQDVNKVKEGTHINPRKRRECFNCGSWYHVATDEKCPARGRKCLRCGIIGHHKLQCQTNLLKKKLEDNVQTHESTTEAKKPRKETDNIDEQKNTEYRN